MIIVLDTNIWLKELALNSGAGSALRFHVKKRGDRIALPEVIRLELQLNLDAVIRKAIDDVSKGHRQLLGLFGSMREIVLPSETEIEALVSNVFSSLGVELLEVPFSLDSARSSFQKTIYKLPPSDKTQEFKDGVLWADCLVLLDQDDVLLATQDKAFYGEHRLGTVLAPNLAKEIETKANKLTLVQSITEVLTHIQTEIQVDARWFAMVVQERAHSGVNALLSRTGVDISGEPEARWELFATEKPDLLYFTYEITLPCSDLTGAGRTDISLIMTGNGTMRLDPAEIVDLHTGEERLSFSEPDGTSGQQRNMYVTANIVLGHRIVSHSVRHPVGGTQ